MTQQKYLPNGEEELITQGGNCSVHSDLVHAEQFGDATEVNMTVGYDGSDIYLINQYQDDVLEMGILAKLSTRDARALGEMLIASADDKEENL
jgi:hypothetical protein